MTNKNSLKVGIFILTMFLLCANLFACSIPSPRPQEGIWYCEELMIEIDFNCAADTDKCAKIYDSDGNSQDILCRFDYGSLISICSEDQQTDILIGNFRYKNDLFSVTTIDKSHTYVFERIDG